MKVLAVFALSISLYGSSVASANAPSDKEQVRQTYHSILSTLLSDHPARACRYYAPGRAHQDCLEAIITLRVVDIPASAVIPYGWQQRLAKAKIVVNGNRAVIVSGVVTDKGHTKFVRINGRWFRG